jgi:hypothetical protein
MIDAAAIAERNILMEWQGWKQGHWDEYATTMSAGPCISGRIWTDAGWTGPTGTVHASAPEPDDMNWLWPLAKLVALKFGARKIEEHLSKDRAHRSAADVIFCATADQLRQALLRTIRG